MIIFDEIATAYHQNPALGSSDIRDFIRSPQLFKDRQDGITQKETPAMAFGTTSHMCVLEPKRFAALVAVKPAGMSFGSAEGKAWQARNHDKHIVTSSDYQTLSMMHTRMPDEVRRIFARGASEVTVRCVIDGLCVQCRVDHWDRTGGMKYDFKTISAIEKIDKAIWQHRLDIQDRWYSRVIEAETAEKAPASAFIFAETAAPYRWRIVRLDLDYIAIADRDIDTAISGILARNKSGCWEDPDGLDYMASPPAWMNDSDMNEEE